MRTKIMSLLMAATIACIVPAFAPAAATKKAPLCTKAYGVRQAVIKKYGKAAPGRNICRHGIQSKYNKKWSKSATTKQKAQYLRQLKRLNAPPPSMMTVSAVPPKQPPAGTLSPYATAKLPYCTWGPESGGDYNARNGQYIGKYQIGIGHWNSVCRGLDQGPAGQERCAIEVYKSEGLGAWVNC